MDMASNAEVVITYAYDYLGRMVNKEISRGGAAQRSISYIWDNWNIVRETFATNSTPLVTHNIWGLNLDGTLQGAGGVGGLLAVLKGGCAATNSFLCLATYDANGNISEYIDESGEVGARYDYSPEGEMLIESGDLASSFALRFSTKPWCPVTEFYEYQMRKYRPEIGRWLSRDNKENQESAPYTYGLNSSVSYYDYLGYESANESHRPRSVKSIQCIVGLTGKKRDGILGPITQDKIQEFQRLLILAGCLAKGGADGIWGSQTEKAYKECKQKSSLAVNLEISYYCSCEICCGPRASGICADGTPFEDGVLAAPSSIPFGSSISFSICGVNYTNVVHDRGGKITVEDEVCHIDFGLSDHEKCKKKGRETNISGTIKMQWNNTFDAL